MRHLGDGGLDVMLWTPSGWTAPADGDVARWRYEGCDDPTCPHNLAGPALPP